MIEEVQSAGGFTWVTAGREVENYIPHQSLTKMYEKPNLPQFGSFVKFEDYLNGIESGIGDDFVANKPTYASQIVEYMTREDIETIVGLKEQVMAVCNKICEWNHLPCIRSATSGT